MNKVKYLNKLKQKQFMNEGKFLKTVIVLNNGDNRLVCNKVKKYQDLKEYVRKLEDFENKNFLVLPKTVFNTNGFNLSIDVVIIDNNFRVVDVFENMKPNHQLDFFGKFYSILIMQSNKIRFLKIQKGDKLKIKKFIYAKDIIFYKNN